MKFLSLFSLAIALMFTACKPDAPAQAAQQTTPTTEQTDTPEVTVGKDLPTTPGQNAGHVATPVLPDLSDNITNLLVTTFWVAEHWVDHANNSNNKPNKGRWWRFNKDGTYVTGIWEETLTHGSWVLYADSGKNFLHLDAAEDALDMEFEIQQVVTTGEYMSWTGTKLYKMNRIAVKAISLLSIPTKAQFGFEG